MSYKLYTDKNNKFQCTVQVEGTSLKNSQARVIIETSGDVCYMFRGKIYENGVCEFEVPKLKNILSEGDKGILRMEVIADDVHFEPWNSEFSVVAEKKVSVVVKEQEEIEKPKISVGMVTLSQEEKPKKVMESKTTGQRVISKQDIIKKMWGR
jgi:hypothetical protein